VKKGRLVLVAFVSALGGYLFGFDFAVISGALPFLQKQFDLGAYGEGFVTGSLALGAIGGCMLAGYFSDRFGRRAALLLAAGVFLFSSLAMALAPGREIFVLARFCAGAGVGMASVISPMYIAEISPARIRGRMVAINQLTIVTGILVTNLVNYSLRHLGGESWRWMFGLGMVPAFLFVLGSLWLPESPRWLFRAGRPDKARQVLDWLGNEDLADPGLQALPAVSETGARPKFAAIFTKGTGSAVVLGMGLAVFQQLCGINVVFNYTAKIFESIGASQDDQLLQTVFIGGINLCFTILAMALVDRWGRKPLMMVGAAGLAISYIVVAQMLRSGSASVSWYLLSAIGIYAMTLAPVTWVLISEIFPNRVRGAATSMAVVSLWAAYFILIFTFPILFSKLRDNTFYIYAGICVLGLFFIRSKVRESKGKSLEQMEETFIGH
jgi:sugar porter (SP) family MFS transporter